MKYWKKITAIVALIALMALLIVKLKTNKQTTESKVYRYDKANPVLVEVDTVRSETISEAGVYTGTFEPNRETKISADVQGKINAVLVDVGSYVHRGQTLIQLDNSLLKLQLQSVDVQIEGLKNDVKRYTVLTEADAIQGVQLEKAKLGLKSARVQKANLVAQIAKTAVRAPFSGVVTAKLSEAGGFAAPGVPLLQITDISSLRFTVNVSENDLAAFQANQNFLISPDAFSNIQLAGTIIMTGSKANIGNNFPVQLRVANTKNLTIKSGMFGKVTLLSGRHEQGLVIPSSAIVEEGGKPQVYLVKNGKAVLHAITTSKNIGNRVIVSDGLQESDIVITNGFINLFDSASIVVK